MNTRATALSLLALTALGLSACTDNATPASGAQIGNIAVTSTADACEVSASETESGTRTFTVTNKGSDVTEFYLLAEDGLRIIGEVENIGPGLTRELTVKLPAGAYKTACKPGMVGEGIRADFTVKQSANEEKTSDSDQQLIDAATAQYAAYVKDQSQQLLEGTQKFAAAYAAGNTAEAKKLYASTRMHWERIEPVAESFGDLDPQMDAREADLEKGQKWTGWHRAEKDLWAPAGYTPQTQKERQAIADKLVADTKELVKRTSSMKFTVDQIANGSKTLLDEVATGKVTGEEEAFSHTDLWDFQGNLDGAKVAYDALEPIVKKKSPELAASLQERFAKTQKLLDQHKSADGWVTYDKLSEAEVKELSTSVEALTQPLSKLTAAVLG